MKQFFKIFIVFFVIFTMMFGTGLYLIVAKENKEDSISKEELNVSLPPTPSGKGEKVNVLLMGVDSLDSQNGESSRTDTMMLLSLDSKNKNASILSIPRDTRVKIRGRKGYDKINAAYGQGGVDTSIKAVKDLVGVPIHHYVLVDYKALFKTVDDVGGVEVDVPFHMRYDDPYAKPPLHINLKGGKQVLDADKAMQFVRFRKTNKKGYRDYPNQDLGRIQAQQQFLSALAKKVLTPSSIFRIPKYIETMHMYVDTDMSKKEMVSLALSAKNIDTDTIQKETIPGEPMMINGVSYYTPNVEEIEDLVGSLYYGDTSENKKEDVKIAVLNGSGRSGIATRVSDMLAEEGLKPDVVENADDFSQKSTIIYYNDNKDEAEKVKKTIGRGTLVKNKEKLDKEKVDIIVLIGKDI